jgi:hypothetical protein
MYRNIRTTDSDEQNLAIFKGRVGGWGWGWRAHIFRGCVREGVRGRGGEVFRGLDIFVSVLLHGQFLIDFSKIVKK